MTAPERMTVEEIDALRLKAFRTNLETDRMAYFNACSHWFQNHWTREMEREALFDAHIGAVLAEAAAACERVAYADFVPHDDLIELGCLRSRDAILALNPTALTALDRALREARVEALTEAAEVCLMVIKSYGIMKPGKPDVFASREAQICAKGFVRLVEEEIRALIEAERGKP